MEADTKKAMADAAYEIQKEEQRKTIEIATANADIAKQEREIELKQKEVAVKEQSLEAEIKKQAEADKYAAQQKADAELYKRQKEAEAKKYEMQQEAEAMKAKAEAEKYAKAQNAEGIRAIGLAEAETIKAKSVAEAEGIERKAEAQAKMGQASVIDMLTAVIPEVAKSVAEPLAKVDKITMYGDGNSTKLIGDITNSVTKVIAGVGESTGVDISKMVKDFAEKTNDKKDGDVIVDLEANANTNDKAIDTKDDDDSEDVDYREEK